MKNVLFVLIFAVIISMVSGVEAADVDYAGKIEKALAGQANINNLVAQTSRDIVALQNKIEQYKAVFLKFQGAIITLTNLEAEQKADADALAEVKEAIKEK